MVADEDGSTPKQQRESRNDHLFRWYPAQGGGGGSLDALKSTARVCQEMKRASPRDHVILPLLKSTHEDTQAYIQKVMYSGVSRIL
jgi:hypothetical protein